MTHGAMARAEGVRRLWQRPGTATPHAALRMLAVVAALVAILAINYTAGPTFSFGGLYAVTICTAAWLLGFGQALALGAAVIVVSTWMNGVGGPYGGAAWTVDRLGLAIGVALRAVSLLAAVTLIVRVRGQYETVRRQADRDPLTGLHNHRAFRDSLDASLARTARGGQVIALAFVDLDDFKAINDRLGHLAGDRALRSFAEAARTAVRLGDCVARLGGDEFAIVIEARDAGEAADAAARIHARIAGYLAAEGVALSFSMGAVIADRPESCDAGGLLQAADALMYRSKRTAKGTLTVAGLADAAEDARLAA